MLKVKIVTLLHLQLLKIIKRLILNINKITVGLQLLIIWFYLPKTKNFLICFFTSTSILYNLSALFLVIHYIVLLPKNELQKFLLLTLEKHLLFLLLFFNDISTAQICSQEIYPIYNTYNNYCCNS